MILYLLYFCLIGQLFVLEHAKPLTGEHVWPADPGQFPFTVSFGVNHPNGAHPRAHFCTGTLITVRHVLTAAHCLAKYHKDMIDVIVGEVDLTTAQFRYKMERWLTYDSWARSRGISVEFPVNDIAIAKLTSLVTRPDVKPVVISGLNDAQVIGRSAVLAGWGRTNGGRTSAVLRRGRVRILTSEECHRRMKQITNQRIVIPRNYLCSGAGSSCGYVLGGCGDSGGPVLDQDNKLLGVTRGVCPNETIQWGDFPSEFVNQYKVNVHSSVDYYREFIESVTNHVETPRLNRPSVIFLRKSVNFVL